MEQGLFIRNLKNGDKIMSPKGEATFDSREKDLCCTVRIILPSGEATYCDVNEITPIGKSFDKEEYIGDNGYIEHAS